jgi:hypothetical protein
VAGALTGGASGAPAWLASLKHSAGAWAAHHGALTVTLLATVEALVGLGALVRRTRMAAVTVGLALTVDFWVLGQNLGGLYSGQATDPNSGPLLALMAIALLACPGFLDEPASSRSRHTLVPWVAAQRPLTRRSAS